MSTRPLALVVDDLSVSPGEPIVDFLLQGELAWIGCETISVLIRRTSSGLEIETYIRGAEAEGDAIERLHAAFSEHLP